MAVHMHGYGDQHFRGVSVAMRKFPRVARSKFPLVAM